MQGLGSLVAFERLKCFFVLGLGFRVKVLGFGFRV